MPGRVGLGFDIHRLAERPGATLALGGLSLPVDLEAVAHSDGDVLLHALCDALLGAVAAGDIGEHFPDHEPRHRARASQEFLAAVLALPQLRPWRLVNCDCNIIAERPRLGAHKPAIRIRLAELLGLTVDAVSVKARSHEGVDAIGTGQAIAAQVVVLLEATDSHGGSARISMG